MEAGFVGSQSDPGGEGFVEESMWRMGVSGGHEMYPERPDESDCKYYLRTGVCGYGSRCRFNHPPDRNSAVGAVRLTGGEYPQRVGQPACKYYMMTGACKFGSSCKYHHPRQGGGTHASLNYLGYPLRPGEKECAYYVKTRQCKFGVTCKFHHPQPTDIPVTTASPVQGMYPPPQLQPPSISNAQTYGVVPSNWQVARQPTLLPYPYMQGPYTPMVFPHHGMVPMPGWAAPFPAHVNVSPASPTPQPTLGSNPLYGISQLSSSAAEYTGPYSSVSMSVGPSSSASSQKDRALPERSGEPVCQYYLKTGECKYGSSCRYHHPSELFRSKPTSESANLPIRPGAPICIYYAQYGVCKYGSACKYDHTSRAGTLSYSPSASSLTDVAVAPLPVGSSTGTLAASSSSSDLHQELAAVSRKDSSPTPIVTSSLLSPPTAGSSITSSQHPTAVTGSIEAHPSS